MDFLVGNQQLHCEVALPALVKEAFVLLVWHIILYDILLVGVNELFDVIECLGVAEALGPYLLMDILSLVAVVRIYERHYELLVLIFLELVLWRVGAQVVAEVEDVEIIQVWLEEELDPKLHVDLQLLLQLWNNSDYHPKKNL